MRLALPLSQGDLLPEFGDSSERVTYSLSPQFRHLRRRHLFIGSASEAAAAAMCAASINFSMRGAAATRS